MRTTIDENVRATYKVPEAARVAGCGESAIRRGIRNGTIPHLRLGRTIIIPRNAFRVWLDSCGGRASV
jgi:excisionase family DNA binding protein